MKNIIVLITLATVLTIVSCQKTEEKTSDQTQNVTVATSNNEATANASTNNEANKEFAVISFKETTFDFGTIKQGDKVNFTFEFKNEGKVPLIISDVKPSCGCTTPDWTKSPVAPGESGKIDVEFNSSGKSGIQVKNITVLANIAEGSKVLQLKGNIETTPEIEGPFKKK
ncbi:MAG: DUF1573 domain-containing protein [Flammeovirgaceae bacterium]